MTTPLDLTFRKDDKVYLTTSSGIHRQPAEIVHDDGEGTYTVRYKHGPRWDDWTQTEVKAIDKSLRFACHTHGAPFESLVLDEEGMERDGYHSGLAIGLHDQFYLAGGPWAVALGANSSKPCRHMKQHDEFALRNNKAWLKGWAAGQGVARMGKSLDFTKALRVVKDRRPVTYVGPLGENHVVAINDAPPPIVINARGSVLDRSNPYGVVIENVPEARTTILRFRPDGALLGEEGVWRGAVTADDVLITVTIIEGTVTALEVKQ